MTVSSPDYDWNPFIGRALALMCLHQEDMRSKSILEQSEFLMRLGLLRKDAAVILGTTDNSLRVLAQRKTKNAITKAVK